MSDEATKIGSQRVSFYLTPEYFRDLDIFELGRLSFLFGLDSARSHYIVKYLETVMDNKSGEIFLNRSNGLINNIRKRGFLGDLTGGIVNEFKTGIIGAIYKIFELTSFTEYEVKLGAKFYVLDYAANAPPAGLKTDVYIFAFYLDNTLKIVFSPLALKKLQDFLPLLSQRYNINIDSILEIICFHERIELETGSHDIALTKTENIYGAATIELERLFTVHHSFLAVGLREMGAEAADKVREIIRNDLQTSYPTIAEQNESTVSRFYHATGRTFSAIAGLVKSGEIDPFIYLDILLYHSSHKDFLMHKADREINAGFWPVASNPFNLGHENVAALAVYLLKLDFVLTRPQGKISYKDLLPSEQVSVFNRHLMTREVLKDRWPFIRYTDLCCDEKNEEEGAASMHHLFLMHPDQKLHLFCLIGAENEARIWRYIRQHYEAFKAYDFGSNLKHRVTFSVVQRGEYGRILTLEELRRISSFVQRETGCAQFLDVALLQHPDIDLNVSSTYYRNSQDPAYVSPFIHRYSREHGYYGHPPLDPVTNMPVSNSSKEYFTMRLQPTAEAIGEQIKNIFNLGVPGNIALISFDGGSGSGKTTVVSEISEYLKNKHGIESVTIGQDLCLKNRDWRIAMQKLVVGRPLTNREKKLVNGFKRKVVSGQPFFGEEIFFDHKKYLRTLTNIEQFRYSGENDYSLVIPSAYIRSESRCRTEKIPLKKGIVIFFEGKYANREEFQRFYDLRYRLRDSPDRTKAHFEMRASNSKPLDADIQILFYGLGLLPSYAVYDGRTKDAIDGFIDLTGEKWFLNSVARAPVCRRDFFCKDIEKKRLPSCADLNGYNNGSLSYGDLLRNLPANDELKINITGRVWQEFKAFIDGLNNELKSISPSSKIEKIIISSCSFTRATVIFGSDIDDMHIYVSGLNEEQLTRMRDFSTEQFLKISGLNSKEGNTIPQVDHFCAEFKIEKCYLDVKKIRVKIYEHNEFYSLKEILTKNIIGSRVVSKYSCRIKLLLLLGEMSQADGIALLSCVERANPLYKNLHYVLDRLLELRLSQEAFRTVFVLNNLLNSFNRRLLLISSEEVCFEPVLLELCQKGLVEIYENKILLLWMAHSPAFSNKFWTDQIEVVDIEGRVSPIIERVKNKISSNIVNSDPQEIAFRRKLGFLKLQNLDDQSVAWLIDSFAQFSVISFGYAMDFIRSNPKVFYTPLRDHLLKLINGRGILSFMSTETSSYLCAVRMLLFFSINDDSKVLDIASFLYENALKPGSRPEYIVHSAFSALSQLLFSIKDKQLRKDIVASAKKYYKYSGYSWIKKIADKIVKLDEIEQIVEIRLLSDVSGDLPEDTAAIVYNKGLVGLSVSQGSAHWQERDGSVNEPLHILLDAIGSGIVVGAAFSETERLIADTGRLVRFNKNIWIKYVNQPRKEFIEAYWRFDNPYLWSAHHEMIEKLPCQKGEYSQSDIENYYCSWQKKNYVFSLEIAKLAAAFPGLRILLQDYHIYPIAAMLRQQGVDSLIDHFIHIPWPSLGYLHRHMSKDIVIGILEGILGSDKISFSAQSYVENFMRCCKSFLGASCDFKEGLVTYRSRTTLVIVNPISCNFNRFRNESLTSEALVLAGKLKIKTAGKTLILRSERTEFTKGIIEGFMAYREFLRKYSGMRGNVVFLAWLIPSRLEIIQYKQLVSEIKVMARFINREFSPNTGWDGIIETKKDLDECFGRDWPAVVVNFVPVAYWTGICLAADAALVNSMKDGMNLVVKTFADLNEPVFLEKANQALCKLPGYENVYFKPAVLIVSKTIGAYSELKSGVIAIDPRNIDQTANALYRAVTIDPVERARRAVKMSSQVCKNTVYDWTGRLLNKLERYPLKDSANDLYGVILVRNPDLFVDLLRSCHYREKIEKVQVIDLEGVSAKLISLTDKRRFLVVDIGFAIVRSGLDFKNWLAAYKLENGKMFERLYVISNCRPIEGILKSGDMVVPDLVSLPTGEFMSCRNIFTIDAVRQKVGKNISVYIRDVVTSDSIENMPENMFIKLYQDSYAALDTELYFILNALKDFPQVKVGALLEVSSIQEKDKTAARLIFSERIKSPDRDKMQPLVCSMYETNIRIVGGKGMGLAYLRRIPGLNIKNGFNITTAAYDLYIRKNHLGRLINELDDLSREWIVLDIMLDYAGESERKSIETRQEYFFERIRESSRIIRDKILEGIVPESLHRAVSRYTKDMDLETKAWADRSSSTAEDLLLSSFAGGHQTVLNVKGKADYHLDKSKVCWASLFNDIVVDTRNKLRSEEIRKKITAADFDREKILDFIKTIPEFTHSFEKMDVTVLEMVSAKTAAVVYDVDIAAGAPVICINGVEGLGECFIDGECEADVLWVSPKELKIIGWKKGIRTTKIIAEKDNILKEVFLSKDEMSRFCVSDSEAVEVSKMAQRIGNYYRRHNLCAKFIDTEFALDPDGKWWALQGRPEIVWSSGDKKFNTVKQSAHNEAIKNKTAISFNEALVGNPGATVNTLHIVDTPQQINKGDIVVAKKTQGFWNIGLLKATALIVDEGATQSHPVQVSRERNIPAIVATRNGREALKQWDGKTVTFDAGRKTIYFGDLPLEIKGDYEEDSQYRKIDFKAMKVEYLENIRRELNRVVIVENVEWEGRPSYRMDPLWRDMLVEAFQRKGQTLCRPMDIRVDENEIIRIRLESEFDFLETLMNMPICQLEEFVAERINACQEVLNCIKRYEFTAQWLQEYRERQVHFDHIRLICDDIFRILDNNLAGWFGRNQGQVPAKLRPALLEALDGEIPQSAAVWQRIDFLHILLACRGYPDIFCLSDWKVIADQLAEKDKQLWQEINRFAVNYRHPVKRRGEPPISEILTKDIKEGLLDYQPVFKFPAPRFNEVIEKLAIRDYFDTFEQFEEFERTIILYVKTGVDKESSVHYRARIEYLLREKLMIVADKLIAAGNMPVSGKSQEIYEMTIGQIIDKVKELSVNTKNKGLSSLLRQNCFIQTLITLNPQIIDDPKFQGLIDFLNQSQGYYEKYPLICGSAINDLDIFRYFDENNILGWLKNSTNEMLFVFGCPGHASLEYGQPLEKRLDGFYIGGRKVTPGDYMAGERSVVRAPIQRFGDEHQNLAMYLKEINRYLVLTREEELLLAPKIRNGDKKALDKLVKANLRFVVSVVKRYQYQGLSLGELINEGNIGLIKAAKKFNEKKNVKFISYAVWWIRQIVQKAVKEQHQIRLPDNKVLLLNKLVKKIRDDKELSEEETAQYVSLIAFVKTASLDAALGDENEENRCLYDVLPSEISVGEVEDEVADFQFHKAFIQVIDNLRENEKNIIKYYYGINEEQHTLEETGQKFNLTRERARQIKEKALARLKDPIYRKKLEPLMYGGFEINNLADKNDKNSTDNKKAGFQFLTFKPNNSEKAEKFRGNRNSAKNCFLQLYESIAESFMALPKFESMPDLPAEIVLAGNARAFNVNWIDLSTYRRLDLKSRMNEKVYFRNSFETKIDNNGQKHYICHVAPEKSEKTWSWYDLLLRSPNLGRRTWIAGMIAKNNQLPNLYRKQALSISRLEKFRKDYADLIAEYDKAVGESCCHDDRISPAIDFYCQGFNVLAKKSMGFLSKAKPEDLALAVYSPQNNTCEIMINLAKSAKMLLRKQIPGYRLCRFIRNYAESRCQNPDEDDDYIIADLFESEINQGIDESDLDYQSLSTRLLEKLSDCIRTVVPELILGVILSIPAALLIIFLPKDIGYVAGMVCAGLAGFSVRSSRSIGFFSPLKINLGFFFSIFSQLYLSSLIAAKLGVDKKIFAEKFMLYQQMLFMDGLLVIFKIADFLSRKAKDPDARLYKAPLFKFPYMEHPTPDVEAIAQIKGKDGFVANCLFLLHPGLVERLIEKYKYLYGGDYSREVTIYAENLKTSHQVRALTLSLIQNALTDNIFSIDELEKVYIAVGPNGRPLIIEHENDIIFHVSRVWTPVTLADIMNRRYCYQYAPIDFRIALLGADCQHLIPHRESAEKPLLGSNGNRTAEEIDTLTQDKNITSPHKIALDLASQYALAQRCPTKKITIKKELDIQRKFSSDLFSLNVYLKEISRYKLLKSEEELALAPRIRAGDKKALEILVTANLRFVVSIAKRYKNQGLSLLELINVGNASLLNSAKKFNEEWNVKFISYAVKMLNWAIQSAIKKEDMVHLPQQNIIEFKKLNKKIIDGADLTDEEREKHNELTLHLSPFLCKLSLDDTINEDGGNRHDLLAHETAERDTENGAFHNQLKKLISIALNGLSAREREIVKLYFGIDVKHACNVKEIGQKIGLPTAEVLSIKNNVLSRLRYLPGVEKLKEFLPGFELPDEPGENNKANNSPYDSQPDNQTIAPEPENNTPKAYFTLSDWLNGNIKYGCIDFAGETITTIAKKFHVNYTTVSSRVRMLKSRGVAVINQGKKGGGTKNRSEKTSFNTKAIPAVPIKVFNDPASVFSNNKPQATRGPNCVDEYFPEAGMKSIGKSVILRHFPSLEKLGGIDPYNAEDMNRIPKVEQLVWMIKDFREIAVNGKIHYLAHAIPASTPGAVSWNEFIQNLAGKDLSSVWVGGNIGQLENQPVITDNHIHSSTGSDGHYTVYGLINSINKQNNISGVSRISGISLTDHDTLIGLSLIREPAINSGIDFLNGVEFTSLYSPNRIGQNVLAHILAYGFDEKIFGNDDKLKTYLQVMRNYTEKRLKEFAKASQEHPMSLKNRWGKTILIAITEKEALSFKGTAITPYPLASILAKRIKEECGIGIPARIAYYLLFTGKHGYLDNPYWRKALYDCGISPMACENWGSAPRNSIYRFAMPADRLIKIIRDAGGIPVLAHPKTGKYKFLEEDIKDFSRMGIQGIEALATRFSLEDKNFYRGLAQKFGLFIMIGSDYHGPHHKRRLQIGHDLNSKPLIGGISYEELAQRYGAIIYSSRKNYVSDKNQKFLPVQLNGIAPNYQKSLEIQLTSNRLLNNIVLRDSYPITSMEDAILEFNHRQGYQDMVMILDRPLDTYHILVAANQKYEIALWRLRPLGNNSGMTVICAGSPNTIKIPEPLNGILLTGQAEYGAHTHTDGCKRISPDDIKAMILENRQFEDIIIPGKGVYRYGFSGVSPPGGVFDLNEAIDLLANAVNTANALIDDTDYVNALAESGITRKFFSLGEIEKLQIAKTISPDIPAGLLSTNAFWRAGACRKALESNIDSAKKLLLEIAKTEKSSLVLSEINRIAKISSTQLQLSSSGANSNNLLTYRHAAILQAGQVRLQEFALGLYRLTWTAYDLKLKLASQPSDKSLQKRLKRASSGIKRADPAYHKLLAELQKTPLRKEIFIQYFNARDEIFKSFDRALIVTDSELNEALFKEFRLSCGKFLQPLFDDIYLSLQVKAGYKSRKYPVEADRDGKFISFRIAGKKHTCDSILRAFRVVDNAVKSELMEKRGLPELIDLLKKFSNRQETAKTPDLRLAFNELMGSKLAEKKLAKAYLETGLRLTRINQIELARKQSAKAIGLLEIRLKGIENILTYLYGLRRQLRSIALDRDLYINAAVEKIIKLASGNADDKARAQTETLNLAHRSFLRDPEYTGCRRMLYQSFSDLINGDISKFLMAMRVFKARAGIARALNDFMEDWRLIYEAWLIGTLPRFLLKRGYSSGQFRTELQLFRFVFASYYIAGSDPKCGLASWILNHDQGRRRSAKRFSDNSYGFYSYCALSVFVPSLEDDSKIPNKVFLAVKDGIMLEFLHDLKVAIKILKDKGKRPVREMTIKAIKAILADKALLPINDDYMFTRLAKTRREELIDVALPYDYVLEGKDRELYSRCFLRDINSLRQFITINPVLLMPEDPAASTRELTNEEKIDLMSRISRHREILFNIRDDDPDYWGIDLKKIKQEKIRTYIRSGSADLAEILKSSLLINAPPDIADEIRVFTVEKYLGIFALPVSLATYNSIQSYIIFLPGFDFSQRQIKKMIDHEVRALAGRKNSHSRNLFSFKFKINFAAAALFILTLAANCHGAALNMFEELGLRPEAVAWISILALVLSTGLVWFIIKEMRLIFAPKKQNNKPDDLIFPEEPDTVPKPAKYPEYGPLIALFNKGSLISDFRLFFKRMAQGFGIAKSFDAFKLGRRNLFLAEQEAADIQMSLELRCYIQKALKEMPRPQIYLLHYFDNKSGKEFCGGIIELIRERRRKGIKNIDTVICFYLKDSLSNYKRVQESFIVDQIWRGNPDNVVFVYGKDSAGRSYPETFENIFSAKMPVLLANYDFCYEPDYENVELRSLFSSTATALRLKSCGMSGDIIDFSRDLYRTSKMSWASRRVYFKAAFERFRLYRASCVYGWTKTFLDSLCGSLFLGLILEYSQKNNILALRDFLIYIMAPMLIFLKPIVSSIINKLVAYVRDNRTDEDTSGSFWQRKVQGAGAREQIFRFFRWYSLVNVLLVSVYYMLIPRSLMSGHFGGNLLFNIPPMAYLAIYIAWNILTDVLNEFNSEFDSEVDAIEVAHNPQAVKLGISRQHDIISSYHSIIADLIGNVGFLFGLALYGLEAFDLMAPVLLALSLLDIISPALLFILGRDRDLRLTIDSAVVKEGKDSNSYTLSKNLSLIVNPRDIRLRNAAPISDSHQSIVPWVSQLKPILIYQVKVPEIVTCGKALLIQGEKNDPLIMLNRQWLGIKYLPEPQGILTNDIFSRHSSAGWEVVSYPGYSWKVQVLNQDYLKNNMASILKLVNDVPQVRRDEKWLADFFNGKIDQQLSFCVVEPGNKPIGLVLAYPVENNLDFGLDSKHIFLRRFCVDDAWRRRYLASRMFLYFAYMYSKKSLDKEYPLIAVQLNSLNKPGNSFYNSWGLGPSKTITVEDHQDNVYAFKTTDILGNFKAYLIGSKEIILETPPSNNDDAASAGKLPSYACGKGHLTENGGLKPDFESELKRNILKRGAIVKKDGNVCYVKAAACDIRNHSPDFPCLLRRNSNEFVIACVLGTNIYLPVEYFQTIFGTRLIDFENDNIKRGYEIKAEAEKLADILTAAFTVKINHNLLPDGRDPVTIIGILRREFMSLVEISANWPLAIGIMGGARVPMDSLPYKMVRDKFAPAIIKLGLARRTGGGPGIMSAALEIRVSGRILDRQSTNIAIPHEQHLNPHVEVSKLYTSFATRKLSLSIKILAEFFGVGGIGTVDELCEYSVRGLPNVLTDMKYWLPIISGFRRAFKIINKDFPAADFIMTDNPDDAISYIKWHAHKPLTFSKTDAKRCCREVAKGLRVLSYLPPAVNIGGSPSKSSGIFREVVETLLNAGIPVRVTSQKAYKALRKMDLKIFDHRLIQAVLYCPKQTIKCNKHMSTIIVSDLAVHHVLANEAVQAYIFFPGGFKTLNQFFHTACAIQCKILPERQLILANKKYWKALSEPILTQGLHHHDFQLISQNDERFFKNKVDTSAEILGVLMAANIRPARDFEAANQGISGKIVSAANDQYIGSKLTLFFADGDKKLCYLPVIKEDVEIFVINPPTLGRFGAGVVLETRDGKLVIVYEAGNILALNHEIDELYVRKKLGIWEHTTAHNRAKALSQTINHDLKVKHSYDYMGILDGKVIAANSDSMLKTLNDQLNITTVSAQRHFIFSAAAENAVRNQLGSQEYIDSVRKNILSVVNPKGKDIIAVFAAPGPNITDALFMTDFHKTYFIDELPVDPILLQRHRGQWRDEEENGICAPDTYFKNKVANSYAAIGHFRKNIEFYIIQELKRLGVGQDDIRIESHKKGRVSLIFTLKNDQPREIIFIRQDIAALAKNTGLVCELNGEIDIFIQKAAMRLVRSFKEYLPIIAKWIIPGGFMVINDYDPFEMRRYRALPYMKGFSGKERVLLPNFKKYGCELVIFNKSKRQNINVLANILFTITNKQYGHSASIIP